MNDIAKVKVFENLLWQFASKFMSTLTYLLSRIYMFFNYPATLFLMDFIDFCMHDAFLSVFSIQLIFFFVRKTQNFYLIYILQIFHNLYSVFGIANLIWFLTN